MNLADWIFIGGIIICLILGSLFGFGHLLKFLTGGIIGILISVFVCYTFGGLILDIPFVHEMLSNLASHWSHIGWLTAIHPEIIIYYVVLFLITMILRKLIVKILAFVVETDVLVLKIINKVGGALLFTAMAFLIMLFVFQVITWMGGGALYDLEKALSGSSIVKPIFENNPLLRLVEMVSEFAVS